MDNERTNNISQTAYDFLNMLLEYEESIKIFKAGLYSGMYAFELTIEEIRFILKSCGMPEEEADKFKYEFVKPSINSCTSTSDECDKEDGFKLYPIERYTIDAFPYGGDEIFELHCSQETYGGIYYTDAINGYLAFICPHCGEVNYKKVDFHFTSKTDNVAPNKNFTIGLNNDYNGDEFPSRIVSDCVAAISPEWIYTCNNCGSNNRAKYELDPNIAKTVAVLNNAGLTTDFSCEGHVVNMTSKTGVKNDDGTDKYFYGFPYISFNPRCKNRIIGICEKFPLPEKWYLDIDGLRGCAVIRFDQDIVMSSEDETCTAWKYKAMNDIENWAKNVLEASEAFWRV